MIHTAEEKEIATQIYENMFYRITPTGDDDVLHKDAKDCAVVACDWVINQLDDISLQESGTTKIDYGQSKWKAIKKLVNEI